MKKLFSLTACFLLLSLLGQARQITCSSNPARPALVTDTNGSNAWITAYAAANVGDTILLYGSPNSYGTQTILKKITVFGEGWGLSSPYTHDATIFDALTFDKTSATRDGNGCLFSGLVVRGDVTLKNIDSVNLDLIYSPNIPNVGLHGVVYTGATNQASKFHFTRCVLGYVSNSNTNSALFRCFLDNCFISGNTYSNVFSGLVNSTVSHCLIMDGYARTNQNFGSCDNLSVYNNIFLGGNEPAGDANIAHSRFTNNLVVPNGGGMLLNDGAIGSNTCIGNVNSGSSFADFSNLNGYQGEMTIDLNHNYRLVTASQGHNYATDGTDVGPEGGAYPFYLQLGAYPAVPSITKLTITTPRLSVGGQLKFSINATNKNPR